MKPRTKTVFALNYLPGGTAEGTNDGEKLWAYVAREFNRNHQVALNFEGVKKVDSAAAEHFFHKMLSERSWKFFSENVSLEHAVHEVREPLEQGAKLILGRHAKDATRWAFHQEPTPQPETEKT